MSIFRNRTRHTSRSTKAADLSALLDGELGPLSSRQVRAAVDRGTFSPQEIERTRRMKALFRNVDGADRLATDADRVAQAQERVRARLERSLAHRRVPAGPSWWERSIQLPTPVVATATVVLLALAAVVATRSGFSDGGPDMRAVAGRAETLNLQVNVDAAQTEELLRWLNEQQALDTVTIRLPDQAQFQLRGDPVLLRPGLPGEVPMDELVPDGEYRITPLEDADE